MLTRTPRTALLALAVAALLAPAALAAAPEGVDAVEAVAVSPGAPTVFVGETLQFRAAITDADGKDLELAPEWSVEGEIGTIDASGLFTAGPKRASGAVTATLGAKSDTVEVSVVPYGYGACHADGRIAYSVQDGGDSEYDALVMAEDGSGPVILTPNAGDEAAEDERDLDNGRHPCWSPDGTLIVFETETRGGMQRIAVVAPDGSGGRVLLHSETTAYYRPTFSTDGTRILFDARPVVDETQRGPGDICLMNADGAGITRLTTDPADERDACWSPDGTRIAYVKGHPTDEGEISEIWLMDADGSNQERLSPRGDLSYAHPAWSPDGAAIACTLREPGRNGDIALIPLAGGTPSNLTASPESDDYGPAWSWDGARLLYATTDAPGLVREIWRIEPTAGSTPEPVTGRSEVGNYLRWFEYSY